jgi:hypothetical protein
MAELLTSVRDALPLSDPRDNFLRQLTRAVVVVPTPPGLTPAIFTMATIFRELPAPSKLVTKDLYASGIFEDYAQVRRTMRPGLPPPALSPRQAHDEFKSLLRRLKRDYGAAWNIPVERFDELDRLKTWNTCAEVQ